MKIFQTKNIYFSSRLYLSPTRVSAERTYTTVNNLKCVEKKYYYRNGDEIIHTKTINGNLTTFFKNKADGRGEVYQCSGLVDEIPKVIRPYMKISD